MDISLLCLKCQQNLDKIVDKGKIFWAHSDRNWILDGAIVHVSMVGFDDNTETTSILNGKLVSRISPDLKGDIDLTQANRLPENYNIAFIGDTKKGKFDIPPEIADEMLNAPINPNNRSNNDVIHPWINGIDITQRSRNMSIIDFGINLSESEASLYQIPYEYVKKHVKPKRDMVRNHLERTKWWIHGRPAPDLRKAIHGLTKYIATPRVS